MKLSDRPARFIIVPKRNPAQALKPSLLSSLSLTQFTRSQRPYNKVMRFAARKATTFGSPITTSNDLPDLKVVSEAEADGSLLMAPDGAVTLDQLKHAASPDVRVFEEHWYTLARPARPWSVQGTALQKPKVSASNSVTCMVKVVLDDPAGTPLADARVTVFTNEAKGEGVEGTTDRYGRVSFTLSKKTVQVDAVIVEPLHSGWPVRFDQLSIDLKGVIIKVIPIDLLAPDARGIAYGQAPSGAGEQVKVAVIDTGVGPHQHLKVSYGRNTTVNEASTRFKDEDGHGTHVAGVIASTAQGWRRGEADSVNLHAYRIFEANDPYASSFAIAAAIKDAAVQGCDLINLSIGGGDRDEAINDAVDFAWEMGCVCIAATGNDGLGKVDYPARYKRAVAVSAIGLNASWPGGADLSWTLSKKFGDLLNGLTTFFASFSNRGTKVALTAPGVAIVSTIFKDRWGVMSGTSMATPIATGVIARRLAANSAVRDLPRDSSRSQAIVAMAEGAALDLKLPPGMQGKGLAR